MTIEELEMALEGRKVIRHRGRCFINVRTEKEAEHFSKLGAGLSPWPDYCPGYEVYLDGMLDPMIELNDDGEEVDVRAAFLLEHFRTRDGYSQPSPHN